MKTVLNQINATAAGFVDRLLAVSIVLLLLFVPGCCGRAKEPGQKTVQTVEKNNKVTSLTKNNAKDPVKDGTGSRTSTFELPGQHGPICIVDSSFNEVVDNIDKGEYKEAIVRIVELKQKYPPDSPQGEALQYLHADSLFGNTDLAAAKVAYEQFLKDYPDSPLKENVQSALEFIENIDKYKKMYVAPEEDNN